mgnify:CR=1 FL=1|tara:strand:+ start:95 stop:316 length:222 start_codon:yes stop_codon:yes gene_type:complete
MRPLGSYLDGNHLHDDPNNEHGCMQPHGANVLVQSYEKHLYPCYVYDKHGKLLRIEYPTLKEGKKWTSPLFVL